MAPQATRTIENPKSLTILQRIADRDRTAVADCVDTYGNFIWALARKFTHSREEAEAAAQEIFIDIWRYSEQVGNKTQTAEKLLIALIARRRLVKHLR